MITVSTIAAAIETARAGALPGKEYVSEAQAYRAATAPPAARKVHWWRRDRNHARSPSPGEHAARRMTAIEIDSSDLAKLRPEAAARDITVAVLVRRLLERIAADHLSRAILDDDK